MNIQAIQTALQQERFDCWLIYDFQNSNPALAQFVAGQLHLTRRVFIIIPARGEPTMLGSIIDHDALQSLPIPLTKYTNWREMNQKLETMLTDYQVVAMDYSPHGALPTVSRVDAGTVEAIRALGKEVVSAANIFQTAAAQWSAEAVIAHEEDCQRVAEIKDAAFQHIGQKLSTGEGINEYEVQQFIMNQFSAANLITPYPPIVAINAHSGDPHFSPTPDKHAPIRAGDWILIDLWAKRSGYQFIFADMTWVGVAAAQPTEKQQSVFDIVTGARDAAVDYIQTQVNQGAVIEGWQVDDVTRDYISQRGYGEQFFHRTGHSLGPGDNVHGMGANIDNLETHDTRRLAPGIGFSIEPGIYLPEFGIRSEINVYMTENGPQVTTPIQREIICLGDYS
ncbi:Xaa-Pro peptidase family protein [Anaerolineales bacterium HSG6]|nr:Xaa-Pro peptidase family protein [Anaerolineales bacterium HSG6]